MDKKLETFMNSTTDGVFYIGHASALVRIKGELILFDPIWEHSPYGEYWFFYPKQVNCDAILDRVSACVVSHIHEDHLCEKILSKLKCKVYIMHGRPALKERIGKVAEVIEMAPWSWSKITNNVDAFFIPHAFNTIDSSCFVSDKERRFVVYVGNDNFLSEELVDKVKPYIEKIDVAMIPTKFIHYYPFLLKSFRSNAERYREVCRLVKQSADQAKMFLNKLKPTFWFPFGSSLYYAESKDDILNRHLFWEDDLPEVVNMKAGDYVEKCGDRLFSVEHPLEEDFVEHSQGSLIFTLANDSQIQKLSEKVKKAESRIPNYKITVNNVLINLETLEVSLEASSRENCTKFYFHSKEFMEWLNGEITFEQALGTRRFVYYRYPNEYRLDVMEWYNKNL